MISGTGGAQLAAEYINQAVGNAESWERRLAAHGPTVTRDVYDSCTAAIRYWRHVAASWEREIQVYNESTNQGDFK